MLDRTVGLAGADVQFDVGKRPDCRNDIFEIMQHYKEDPNFITGIVKKS